MKFRAVSRVIGCWISPIAGGGAVTVLGFVFAGLVIVFGLILGEKFFSSSTVQSMAFQMPEFGILSLAMMVTLLSGGLNLSIVATANLCALTIGWVLLKLAPMVDSGSWLFGAVMLAAVFAGTVVAVIVGMINGFVVAYLRVSPILATLGTMIACKGLAIGLTHGNVLSGFPDQITFIGNGTVFGVPVGIGLFVLICALLSLLLNRSPFGHKVYLIGSNEKAARFSGIDTRRVLLKVYVLSSVLAGLGGLVMMARFNSANASYGESFLLTTIVAAVLGGIDPFGGAGKIAGLVMALINLQIISSAFNLMNLSQFLTLAIWGGLLIAVASIGLLRQSALALTIMYAFRKDKEGRPASGDFKRETMDARSSCLSSGTRGLDAVSHEGISEVGPVLRGSRDA